MKSILFAILFICTSSTINSQNTNVKDETKTTTTTIVDSKGEKKYIKKENIRKEQTIELKEQNPKNINMDLKDSAIIVVSTTSITNPDGTTRTVDIDRSSCYLLHGKKYNLALDSKGYRILSEDKKEEAFLRKTSINSFIYSNKNRVAIGYFDVEGNLILETHDPKTDDVSYEKYIISK